MIKLFVDDIRSCPDGWHAARTVTEAIRILATQDVKEISLDHDITHAILPGDPAENEKNTYQPVCCPETFEPVAWYLKAIEFAGPITLHTANPAGAEKMKSILSGYFDITVRLGQPAGEPEHSDDIGEGG